MYRDGDIYAITSDPFDGHIYYAVGSKSQRGIVLKIVVDGENISVEESRPLLPHDYFYSIDIQRGLKYEKTLAFLGTEDGKVVMIPLNSLRMLSTDGARIHVFGEGRSAVVAVDPGRPEDVYVGLFGAGVHRSRDSGETWENISEGLISSSINVFELKFSNDGEKLFAGTLGGIVVLTTSESGASELAFSVSYRIPLEELSCGIFGSGRKSMGILEGDFRDLGEYLTLDDAVIQSENQQGCVRSSLHHGAVAL